MSHRPVPLRIAALLVLVAMLFSCSRETASPPTPVPSDDGGTLIRRLEANVDTLNYLLQTTDYERNVLAYLYDPLIDLDENLRPIPGTADRWEVSPDGRTYTLHLDRRATFSDGTRVKASDVVFTIRKLIEVESTQFAGFFEGVDLDETQALDEHTVRVVFNQPLVARWYAFNIGILPEHVYGKGDFRTAFGNTAVGNGAYRLARRAPDGTIVLERRTDYWRAKPPISRILFKVIADPTVAWNALKLGQIDEIRVKTDLWKAERDRPDVQRKITFHDVYLLGYNCIAWNGRDPVLNDSRVRRALAMTFDVPMVIEKLYHSQARPISGPFTPDQWAYNTRVPPVAYDPAGAGALLAAAGWRDTNGDGIRDRGRRTLSFEMLVPAGNAQGIEQSQVLQDALRGIGVAMSIRVIDGASFFEYLMKGKYQAAFMGWNLDPDPDLYSLFHSSQVPPKGMNIVSYSNPEVDRLIEEARREFDHGKRRVIFHRLHELLAADQPYLWSVQVSQKWAVSRRVENVKSSKGYGLFLWHPGPFQWSLKTR